MSQDDATARSTLRRAWIAGAVMLVAAGVGQAIVPTRLLAHQRGNFKLAQVVPTQFGPWRLDTALAGGLVNPQTQALLDKLYSQLLERTYVNDRGERIMLSMAYGEDQSDPSVQLHYPEVCYPAQGFKVTSNQRSAIVVSGMKIPVRRLETHFANQRYEPVTYWTVIGREISLGGWDHKRAEILHGLKGEVVDGMLVRISSIGQDSTKAFALQQDFIKDLVGILMNHPGCELVVGRCSR